jgi:maltokinase
MTDLPTLSGIPYVELLAAYFLRRRWFAGKGREFHVTHLHGLPWLEGGTDPDASRSRIETVTVGFADGTTDTYQFPVAYRTEFDPNLEHALVGAVDHPELGRVVAYDAVYVKDATSALYEGFLAGTSTDELEFHVVDGTELPEERAGTVMPAEQSNTSIVFGDGAILKLFRRISEGNNPDIVIHDALTRDGSEHVAALLGWLHGSWSTPDGARHSGDLGMLQVFLRTATDGWDLALASLRDLFIEEDLHPAEVGGDFAGESERLGEAVAVVHQELARLFTTQTASREYADALAGVMQRRLDEAVDAVPDLEKFAAGLNQRFERLRTSTTPMTLQRVHGDLHLGQTLRTVKGWKLIDFEGEPAKSLAERSDVSSPLRDIAGMLRSFDYAAGVTLHGFGEHPQLAYRGQEWSKRNRESFLAGYESVAGEISGTADLLGAFEADKAIYEAVYEVRNRPTWVEIPLRAIARIAAEE